MFAIGEYIVYGINGICRVDAIGPSPYDPGDPRTYYLLVPVNNPMGSTIYTPVDNDRVPMRALMTEVDVAALMNELSQIEPLSVPAEKQRREIYRTVIATLRPEGYVQVIKTVRRRRVELSAAHKHVPMTDLEYERLARHLLCDEIARVMGETEAEVEAKLMERLSACEA